ncbi:hypothetical protein ACFLYU_04320 [Candidatus Dependentiae bacterium]
MKKTKLLLIMILYCGPTPGNKIVTSPKQIIDNTKDVITVEIKQSTKDLVKILDNTIVNGKLKLFKGLKGKRLSKKKIVATTCQLEKIINEAIEKIENKRGKKEQAIRKKTGEFIAETKKSVFEMHKQMVSEMKKSVRKNPEIVKNNTDSAKNKIAQFEEKIIVKIAKFGDTLKEILK